MKRDFASRLLLPLCGMLALTVTSCNKTAKDQPSRHRLIHNNDGSDALLNRWFGGTPVHKADIDRYVDMVAETSKGDYFHDVHGQRFYLLPLFQIRTLFR